MTQPASSSIFSAVETPDAVNDFFTQFTEQPSRGFNRLVRAQRYGRWWMLKGLKAEYAEQPFYQQLLRKEFEVLIRMQHHNVVTATGFETVEGLGPCIVMEWIDGVSLADWLHPDANQKRWSRGERRRVYGQILDAVEYTHSLHVAHRDLKPSNILVTRNGQMVKLIDFGLSDTDSYAVLKQPAGTVHYVSPEQSSSNQTDVRNDIYSLGCILSEMRLGLLSRFVVRRCKAKQAHRYSDVAALRCSLRRIARVPYYMVGVILLLLLAFLVYIPPYLDDNQNSGRTAGYLGYNETECADTVYVSTAADLFTLHARAGQPNLFVKLTCDIDLKDTSNGSEQHVVFTPIGSDAMFRGTFDGQGHTIRGVHICSTDSSCAGFFGTIENAVIRHLTVEGDVQSAGIAGGLAGSAKASTLEDCHFRGTVVSDECAGGLVAYARLSSFDNCSTQARVTARVEASGFAAVVEENSVLSHCHAQAQVTSQQAVAGGLIGRYFSTLDQELQLSDCSFKGKVKGEGPAAGLVAHVNGRRITVNMADCRTMCNVVSQSPAGGLGGKFEGEGLQGTVANCQATGNVHSTDCRVGGLFGDLSMCNWFYDGTWMTVSDCSFRGSVEGKESVGGLIGYTHGVEDRVGCEHVRIANCQTSAQVRGDNQVGSLVGFLGAWAEVVGCTSSNDSIKAVGLIDGGIIK